MLNPAEYYKERLEETQLRVENLQKWLKSLMETQLKTSENRDLELKQTKIITLDLALIRKRIAEALQD